VNNLYEQKLAAGNSSDQNMFSISWDIEELKSINAQCRKIHHELTYCIDSCAHDFHARLLSLGQQYVKLSSEYHISEAPQPLMCLS